MAANVAFEDFDSPAVYKRSLARAQDGSTHNFVVGFGQKQAKIAFNVSAESVQELLEAEPPHDCPVRWINIWGPHLQTNLIDALGNKYGFSPRLSAIIKSDPRRIASKGRVSKYEKRPRSPRKDDLEVAAKSLDTPRTSSRPQGDDDFSHYAIAKNMEHYQSIDIGKKFICIGANWLHAPAQPAEKSNKMGRKREQEPLWTWLVLCNDNTVISIHEDPGPVSSTKVLKAIRQNTTSILSQLSSLGRESADPISIQTIRQTLDLEGEEASGKEPGREGSSNLFYYLFDDWRAVYTTISRYRKTLEALEKKIIHDMTRTSTTSADIQIIPDLHDLGRQIHKSDHLYAGYQKTISRILTASFSQPSKVASPDNADNQSKSPKELALTQSATHRFERLSDRIQLVILNTTQELLAEKEALVNTYFNINAQKDSEATARLSRAATLLAKLSVLFLPVSLMTSYFSVQIPELQTYTGKDYWYAFAVIFSISFVSLFFFSKLLMWITETLDHGMKVLARKIGETWPGRRGEPTHDPDDDDDEGDEKLE